MVGASHYHDRSDLLSGSSGDVLILIMKFTKPALLTSLFLLSLSGLLLHYRIHNFMVADALNPETVTFSSTNFLAFIFPLIDVVVVTLLFASRNTAVYGHLLNGIIVIYGTVFMAHFSIAGLTAKSAPFADWIIKSTLPDIGIAWADFFTGKSLYDLHMRAYA